MANAAPPAVDSAPRQYGRGAAAFHWVSAILIIFLLLQGFSMTKLELGGLKTSIYQFHVTLGWLVLLLSVLRVWWARRDRRPGALEMPAVEAAAFKGVHYLLVLGAAVTATSGILLLVGSGIVPVGPLVDAADVDGSLIFRNAHFVFALGMVVLLLAHLAGGIMYQRRAGQTFGRMRWPRQSPDPPGA
ncbi:MAG: cytochrome b/b6 domain-containing protein [Candidatus Limnocylindrales bacterium]